MPRSERSRPWRLLLVLALIVQALPAAAVPAPLLPALPDAGDPAADWAAMGPARQRDLRARYAAWQALPETERQRVRQAAARVAALPPGERDALYRRFQQQDRLFRDGWRLGPQLGALYPKLHPLLGYVPAEQRAPLLALLHQLDADQLAQLGLIVQRTPPQEQAELRTQLLALDAPARAQWLRQKVEGR